MNDHLDELAAEPVSSLAHRVRPAEGGRPNAPCLLLLHGVGANEAGFIDMARQMDPRLVVILVRGPLVFAPMKFGWFQVDFTPSGPVINAEQAEQSRTRLVQFIGQLPQAYGVDPRRIWIAGFSQGGIMSASVGLSAPAAVAGFGILSGRILPEVLPRVERVPALREVRAFVSHGTDDQVLGIHFAHNAKNVLSDLGVPLEYHEYEAGHRLVRAMIADFTRWLDSQLGREQASTAV